MSVVIFLVATFFSIPLVAVYGAEGDKACAEFDEKKGDKKSDDGTVSKNREGGVVEAKNAVKNASPWTKDSVQVNKDGTFSVESKCGVEGTRGTVKFCILGTSVCVTVDKKGDDKGLSEIEKDSGVKEGLQKILDAERENLIKRAAETFKSGAKLPEEFNPFINGLSTSDKVKLANLSQEDKESLLRKMLEGDANALNTEAERLGLRARVTQEQLKALSEGVQKLVPPDVLKKVADAATQVCGFGGGSSSECESIVKKITGFVAPTGIETTGSIPVIDPKTVRIVSRDVPSGVRANIAQQVYSELEKKGFSQADLMHPESKRFEAAWRTTTEVLRNSLNNNGALHPLLDQASVLALVRREQGIPGNAKESGTGVRGQLQMTGRTARSTLGNVLFTANGGQKLDTTTFAREDQMGSVISGSIHLNQLLHKYVPVQEDGSYNRSAAATAFQAYNGFFGVGGDRDFGVKAAHDAEVFRQVLQTGDTSALVRLKPDRSRGSNDLALYSRILTTQPSDTSALPSPTYDPNPSFRSASPVVASLGKSPFGLSSGGIGGLLKKFIGGGRSSGSSGGGGSFGGGGSSGSFSDDTSNNSSGTSNSQPLPPVEIENNQSNETQTGDPVPPSLSLVVHPSTAQKGESVSVIWSTIGVSTTRVCQLSAESTEGSGVIAEGNEGTKVIQVPVNTPLTELRFSLRCVPKDTRINPEDAQTSFILRIN